MTDKLDIKINNNEQLDRHPAFCSTAPTTYSPKLIVLYRDLLF
jgi:hypothetical protein